MRLTIEQLRAFVETVDQGGFRQAGVKPGKHGSTVGQQVAGLEIDYALDLFQRSRRSVTLTETGKALYDHAVAVIREAENFDQRADSLSAGDPSQLVVAQDTALAADELSAIYQQLFEAFPAIELKVMAGETLQVSEWVQSGHADVG